MYTVGTLVKITGNFTMLRYIHNLGPDELERTVGFHPGRLSSGFAIAALSSGDKLSASEIDLLGSTRWSGGRIGSTDTQEGRDMACILEARGQDLMRLKNKVCAFFNAGGSRAPAKVLPFVRHQAEMLYPDAEAIAPGIKSGIPQFNLTVPHGFTVIRVYRPTGAPGS